MRKNIVFRGGKIRRNLFLPKSEAIDGKEHEFVQRIKYGRLAWNLLLFFPYLVLLVIAIPLSGLQTMCAAAEKIIFKLLDKFPGTNWRIWETIEHNGEKQ